MLKPRITKELREELLGQRSLGQSFGEEKNVAAEKKEPEKVKTAPSKIHFSVRYDFKGRDKPAKFFFGGKDSEEVARLAREQQVTLWQHVPVQGISIVHIDEKEIYTVMDEDEGEEVAYAPLLMEIKVEAVEDIIRFVVREEFRRIEILEPKEMTLTSQELARLLFKFHQSSREQVALQIKKLQE